jgi:uncharacterized protein (DUF1800 family)
MTHGMRWRSLALLLLGLSTWDVAHAAAPTPAEASRLLTQATFGPTDAEIERVHTLGVDAWLADQFARQPTLHRPAMTVQPILGLQLPIDLLGEADSRQEAWWRIAITADDQLRQRVAFALSEILVVSDQLDTLNLRPLLSAEFYDILVRNAFGSYRTLLEEVSRAPAMGMYLSSIRNDRPAEDGKRRPDENYAREVMQLFSIGLWQLDADGSPRLDGSGQRIPTYSQETVENMARVFTGWTWDDASSWEDDGESYAPMKAFDDHHDALSKQIVGGAALPAAQSAAQDLASALDALVNHPNVGPFLGRRLIQRLTTSNPSPAYIGRVAAAFADNGAGQRGDLRAVVRAILLDPEARAAPTGDFGKLREPMLRVTALWRAFHASAADGHYSYPTAERDLGQAPLRSPTVFNFFQPDYRAPGGSGLYAPEFQIQTEAQGLAIVNAMTRLIRGQYRGAPGASSDAVTIDIEREKSLPPAALVDRLDLLLLAGGMPASMRQVLLDYLASVPAGDGTQRATEGIFLVVTSPEFAVQR